MLAILGSTMAASAALAQDGERTTPMLDDGTQELSVAGTIDIPESDEIDYDIDGSYGYFIRDGLEIGVEVSGSDIDGADRLEIGGFTEYNFRRDQMLVPYVGGGLGLVSADFDETIELDTPIDGEDGAVFNIEGGVKFFLTPYMAISTAIDFSVSTEDVFETDDAIEDNLTSFKVGMRYYF
jgi:hypothetical protein